MPRLIVSCWLAAALLGAAAISASTTTPALASSEGLAQTGTTRRPAAWHARDRVFAGPPVMRTSDEIREMRSQLRPYPASDPSIACYHTRYIVGRCPQAGRPRLF